jgi:hypothetical protein
VKTRAAPSIVGSPQSNGSSNRLVHFVRQGGSQLTHRGHSADVCEIRLRLAQRFVGVLLLGQPDGGFAGPQKKPRTMPGLSLPERFKRNQ